MTVRPDSTCTDRATLRYQGQDYVVTCPGFAESDDGYGGALFQWTDGNFGCDCNKALFIGRQCDVGFPDLGCGDAIELVRLEILSLGGEVEQVLIEKEGA